MTKLDIPNTILNDTPADATPVEQNYAFIEQHINQQLINRDGSVAMLAQLLLVGDPVNPLDAASKGYVDALLPVGVMLPFCGPVAPAGKWALCNGASLATATYPKLFNVLGYRYGGSGGTFMVPNMAGRVPIGMDAAQTEFATTGKSGGSFTVPIPQHAHGMPHTHTINHDHGAFDSANNKTDHVHSIAHDHAQFNTVANGLHNHDISYIQDLAHTGGDGARLANYDAAGLHTTTEVEPAHVHAVNIPPYAGNSGMNTTDHVHSINVPAYTGASGAVSTPNTANAGTAGVELQPPYVVINYIVRID